MKNIFILSISLLGIISCDKNNEETPPPVTETIHMCGSIIDQPNNIAYACYWKNGVPTSLSTGLVASGHSEIAEDMAVYNNDVYIVGVNELPSGRGTGVYWKNGTKLATLDDGLNNIVCTAIAVNANGVHIAVNQQNSSNVYTPRYWKDGAMTTLMLSGTVPNVFLSDITTSGNDVYILGTQVVGANRNCILWKNGSATIIPLVNTINASNFRLAVSGSYVFISTNENPIGSNVSRIMFYKNNEAPVAITSATLAGARDIVVNGSDVYISGVQENTSGTFDAAYWKNGTKVSLGGTVDSELNSVFIKNTDVYACGVTNVNNKFTATYWKNSTATVLGNGTLASYPSKIIVQ